MTMTALMLTGCRLLKRKRNWKIYRLVTSNADRLNENQIVVENNTYDFGKDKMNSTKYKIDLTTQFNFAVVKNDKGIDIFGKGRTGNSMKCTVTIWKQRKQGPDAANNLWGINEYYPAGK